MKQFSYSTTNPRINKSPTSGFVCYNDFMADEAKDILRKAFGEPQPLTEAQKQTRRNAAAFAIITFSESFGDKKRLDEMHVNLTPEQLRFAKCFTDVFPKPEDVLPKSEFNSAMAGYSNFVGTPMYEIIPALLTNENQNFGGNFKAAGDLFRQDPSGVSYLQSLLNDIEEKARHGKNTDIKSTEKEARLKIFQAMQKAEGLSDQIPEKKSTKSQSIQESIMLTFLEAFGSKQSPRDAFISESRDQIHKEIPLEFAEDKKMYSSDALIAEGARLAFEKYQTAVSIYLNRWGK